MTYQSLISNNKKSAKQLNIEGLRNTDQFVMPALNETGTTSGYDIYPSFKITQPIHSGYESLGEYIIKTGGNFITKYFFKLSRHSSAGLSRTDHQYPV